ncbi:MAG: hypothetical protein V7604_1069 [Hyphomicrobiales bacterium]
MRLPALFRTACAAIALAIIALSPAGAGDFGRPKPSLLDGFIPPQFWKGPVTGLSAFPLTDLENELRDRSYALIRPNEPRGNWSAYIAAMQIAHFFSKPENDDGHTDYARMLLLSDARSEASAYNRLIEDTTADGMLISPFVAVACAVADLDQKRLHSLAYVGELDEREIAGTFGRVRENRMVTAWVQDALHERHVSYRYALERLVIKVPSVLAVDAERSLKRFEAKVLAADVPLTQCSGGGLAVLRSQAGRPLVTK